MSLRLGPWTTRHHALKLQATSYIKAYYYHGSKKPSPYTSHALQSQSVCKVSTGTSHSSSTESDSDSKRIHILGVGNLGRLYAHALATLPSPPPITLLLHRSSLQQEWDEAGRQISITTHGVQNSIGGFTVEDISSPSPKAPMITNLILATKTLYSVSALEMVKDRLNEESTLLFTQNGMGTVEEVDRDVFGDVEACRRPNYLTSITSHGVYSLAPFSSVHAGLASVSIGRAQAQGQQSLDPSKAKAKAEAAQYLIDRIIAAPVLNATQYPPAELFHLQLEKLVMNAMINPLTAVLHCKNGLLFSDKEGPIMYTMRLLLREASQVIQALLLPSIQNPNNARDAAIKQRFSTQALERIVLEVAVKTATNTSSMLQDVQGGRRTEIEYINGWIVRKGRELGVSVGCNERLVEMVREGRGVGVGVQEFRERIEGLS